MQDVWFFLAGYALPLLTPGANMFMVASVAVLGGRQAAAHLIAGLSIGAAALAILLMMAGAAIDLAHNLLALAAIVAALALGWVAWSVAPRHAAATATATEPEATSAPCKLAGFTCGLWTSITNPVTATYFASQLSQRFYKAKRIFRRHLIDGLDLVEREFQADRQPGRSMAWRRASQADRRPL